MEEITWFSFSTEFFRLGSRIRGARREQFRVTICGELRRKKGKRGGGGGEGGGRLLLQPRQAPVDGEAASHRLWGS